MEGNVGGFNYTNIHGILWGLSGGAAYGFFSAYSTRVPEKDHLLFLFAAVSSGLLLMFPGLLPWFSYCPLPRY